MNDGTATNQRKSSPRPRPRPAAPLNRQRTIEELKRFLDLLMRDTKLAVHYEISAAEVSSPVSDASAPSRADDLAGEPGNIVPKDRQAPSQEADITVRFSGEDEDILLSRNGELLLALEYLAHRWLRLEPALHDRVRFDCGDYRAARLEELKLSARVAAQRVRETGQPFPFNPMSSRDRRIIHLELNGAPGVRTISEGSGDRRHLVIYPVTHRAK
jgi:spoIIIJ-associated protein